MTEEILKLLLAVIIGSLIGAERQVRHGVGFRTIMLVCLGAALFTMYSDIFSPDQGDPRRIAAAVVTGVGFLGAGMILRERGQVLGLTTAATVWLAAALGMGIAIEQYVVVAVSTFLVLFILWAIPRLDPRMRIRQTYKYELKSNLDEQKYADFTGIFLQEKLEVAEQTISKEGDSMRCSWRAYGSPEHHDRIMRRFLTDPDVQEFHIE